MAAFIANSMLYSDGNTKLNMDFGISDDIYNHLMDLKPTLKQLKKVDEDLFNTLRKMKQLAKEEPERLKEWDLKFVCSEEGEEIEVVPKGSTR